MRGDGPFKCHSMKLILQLMQHAVSYIYNHHILSFYLYLSLSSPSCYLNLTHLFSTTVSPSTLLKSSCLLSTSPFPSYQPSPLKPNSLPSSASVLPPCSPFVPPTHSLSLSSSFSLHLAVSLCSSHTYYTSICFLTTCPFLSLSVPPSPHLSRRSVVI